MEYLDMYTKFLWECFQYDISVYTNIWMYVWLLIPILFYTVFFIIKWSILLLPITICLRAISNIFRWK
jgi:hypothetical protein